MSFLFTMRKAQPDVMLSRNTSSLGPLPRIEEDNTVSYHTSPGDSPPGSQRAWNRPPKNYLFDEQDSSPVPSYTCSVDAVEGPKGEKLAELRRGIANNRQIAGRGGWKKLCLFGLLIIATIVALAVGLAVGLRKHKETKSTSNNSSDGDNSPNTLPSTSPTNPTTPTNPSSNTAFPAGSYNLTTYLNTIATNCTSSPSTWTCYPYATYAEDRNGSSASFQWIINTVTNANDPPTYTISSTPNIFSILFTNITLTLQHEGKADEAYYFRTTTDKITKPAGQIGSQNVQATCTFPGTTFQGYLYTKMAKTFPTSTTTTTDTTQPYAAWPYALKIEQIAAAGGASCVGPDGQSLGSFGAADGELCDCLYLNYGT